MADVTIDIIKNGPLIVKGEVELRDSDGNPYPAEKRMALCRCGASTNKPFCDGTHPRLASRRPRRRCRSRGNRGRGAGPPSLASPARGEGIDQIT